MKSAHFKKVPLLVGSVLVFSFLVYFFTNNSNKNAIETIWGEKVCLDQMTKDLANTDIMQRIKDVDQSGPAHFFGPKLPKFTRYDHSLGVWALVNKAKGSKKEQAAAVLHDASHTVFSHVADYLDKENLMKYVESAYQDSIHMSYIRKAKLGRILSNNGLIEDDLNPDLVGYRALEQKLPDMCADRIEYNIHTAVLFGKLSQTEAREIIDDLHYDNGQWYFTNPLKALRIAEISVYYTQNFWGAKWNTSMNIHLAAALRRALEIGLLSMEDLYKTDSFVMQKLLHSDDSKLKKMLHQCSHPLEIQPGEKYTKHKITPKFRGIDPLVKDPKTGDLVRLSSLDVLFNNYYEAVKDWCAKGFEVEVLTL